MRAPQDDLGWSPWSLHAFKAEMDLLRRASFAPAGKQMHALPGFVRWEGSSRHPELNEQPSVPVTHGPRSSHQPLEHIIGNDLFFRLCVPPRLETHTVVDGSTRYFEMCNPVSATGSEPIARVRVL